MALRRRAEEIREVVLDRESRADALVARGVSKSFDAVVAVDGADLTVPAGSIVALLGPSGCGKTTLLRCVAGLEHPDSGEIRLDGRLLTGPGRFVRPERRGIGMVFQDLALFPHLTVRRNVGFGLRRGEAQAEAVDECLAMVGLQDCADRMPATLSGGQQQRVALARALAHGPGAVLLDEPFSNLDAVLRVQIRKEVKRLLAELGVTALFVTHDQEEAFALGDSVAVMFDGTVHQQACPTELYDAPATRPVAQFVGDANFLPGTGGGERAHTRLGIVPLSRPAHGETEVMVRPEAVVLSSGSDAVVEGVEFFGHDSVCRLRCPDGFVLRARMLATPSVRPGDVVSVSYSGRPTVAFPPA